MRTPSVEYTQSHQIIAAGLRLREAWDETEFEVKEMHESVLGLISATGAKDLSAALGVLQDVESGYGHGSD